MNRYETVFIMTPVLSEEQAAETVDHFKKLLGDGGAKFTHEEDWGLRKLAYPIQKKSTGFYRLLEFEATSEVIEGLETQFKRDEHIIRSLTTKMNKHQVTYAEGRRDRSPNVKKKAAASK